MISTETLKYSLKNLVHRKARSSLTILSIFIGIVTIFIFVSFGIGLFNFVNNFASETSADKIIIQAKGGGMPGLDDTFALTEEELKIIQDTPGVIEATGVKFKTAEIKKGNKNFFSFVISYDPEKPLILELSDIDIIEGRGLRKKDLGKVVAGYNYMLDDKIFSKALKVNDKIEVQGQKLKIIGFFDKVGNPQDDSQLYVTEEQLDLLYPGNNSFGWIVARIDLKKINTTIEKIEENLREHRNLEKGKEDFFVQSFEDLIASFSSALNIVVFFVVLIALISVIVSAINTANTMITSVLERYKEIGIMKAVGSSNLVIFNIFLLESSILGFIAGVLGVLVGWALSAFAGNVLNNLGWGFLSPAFPASLFIGCILFATITGAVSGAIPAWQASKTNIVDALRYE